MKILKTTPNPFYTNDLINPADLNIGNLVTDEWYKDFESIITVESIDKNGINLKIEDDGDFPECATTWIEPTYKFEKLRAIPISKHLLVEKLGAVELTFKNFLSFNLKGMQINYIDNLWIEYVSRVEIKGLHHLQNIFYFSKSETLDVSALVNK